MAATNSASVAVAPGTKTKKTKSAAAVKETKAKKPAVAHPTFLEMITDAIVTLKERTGSSQYAINKFIKEKYKQTLTVNFNKILLVRLKKLVGDGKLVKVKNSFKIPAAAARSSAPAVTEKKPAKAAAPAPVKQTSKAVKPKAKNTKPKAATVAKPKKKSSTAALSVKTKKIVKSSAVKKPKAKSIRSPVKKAPVAKKAKKPKAKSIRSPAKKAHVAKKAKK